MAPASVSRVAPTHSHSRSRCHSHCLSHSHSQSHFHSLVVVFIRSFIIIVVVVVGNLVVVLVFIYCHMHSHLHVHLLRILRIWCYKAWLQSMVSGEVALTPLRVCSDRARYADGACGRDLLGGRFAQSSRCAGAQRGNQAFRQNHETLKRHVTFRSSMS